MVQVEVLVLELHLLDIVTLQDPSTYSSEYSGTLECFGSKKSVSRIYGIVVVHGILLFEIGIAAFCFIHEIFVFHQCINAAAKRDIFIGLDARVHGPYILVYLELARPAYHSLRCVIKILNLERL